MKKMIEVWDSTNGQKSAVLGNWLKDEFDVRYERFSTGYTYYRIKGTHKDVKKLFKHLKKDGYYGTLTDNRYFHVYE